MKSLWSDAEAQSFVARYADKGVNTDLALRVYTTRLLGGDPKLYTDPIHIPVNYDYIFAKDAQ